MEAIIFNAGSIAEMNVEEIRNLQSRKNLVVSTMILASKVVAFGEVILRCINYLGYEDNRSSKRRNNYVFKTRGIKNSRNRMKNRLKIGKSFLRNESTNEL